MYECRRVSGDIVHSASEYREVAMLQRKKRLTLAISTLMLAASAASLPAMSQEVPEGGEVPESELPELEPAADVEVIDGVARDADGYAYPEGGPAGLYRSIVDKQNKLGETVEYDANGDPIVTPGSGTYGHQVALEKQRRNLERKLEKEGVEFGAPEDDVEIQPVDDVTTTGGNELEVTKLESLEGEGGEPDIDLPELTGEELSRLAHDVEGEPYPEGGPKGLYKAIVDKQDKLGERVEIDVDTGDKTVVQDGSGNGGLGNALGRLRANLERKLEKMGMLDDTPETPDGDLDGIEAVSLGVKQRGKSGKPDTVTVSGKSQKPQRVSRLEKTSKPVKPERVEKAAKVERVQKPEKVTRVAKPEKPVKVSRVQRPEKVERFSKPEKPQKPEKPGKPERPR